MERWILAVDKNLDRHVIMQKAWHKFQIEVHIALDMPQALEMLLKKDYLLVTIAGDTIEYLPLLKLMRELKPVPILVLTPQYKTDEKINVLEQGADEYIEFPITVEEHIATGLAHIRRFTELNNIVKHNATSIYISDVLVCIEYRKVYVFGKEIVLTRKEFDTLHMLIAAPYRVYTYEQIFCRVWGEEYFLNANNILWCLVRSLRRKMKTHPDAPTYIQNIREVGYRFGI